MHLHPGSTLTGIVMEFFDLGVAWNWQYDADFIALLESGCRDRGLSMLQITPANLADILHSLAEQSIGCKAFFDRASDDDPAFMPLVQWVQENRVFGLNTYERARLTWDKAAMHPQLIAAGLEVPPTIILPCHVEQPELDGIRLDELGEQFTIKPAHGSGGVGVRNNATTWEQILAVRQEHANDKYLLQAHITPIELDARPAWFRVIFCTGQTYPCWWHPVNHVYTPVTIEEMVSYRLNRLEEIVLQLSRLYGLDIFSTEIALTGADHFMVVDYVNDQIDLRLQSTAYEGVPDSIVGDIARRLVSQLVERG